MLCDKLVPAGLREGYLKVVDTWAELDRYTCVLVQPQVPLLCRAKQAQCGLLEMWLFPKLRIFPQAS